MKSKTSQGIAIVGSGNSGSHLAEMAIELSPGEDRPISATVIAQRWRKLVGSIPGADELTFQKDLFSAGDPINVQLSSQNLDDLVSMSNDLKERLRLYPVFMILKIHFSMKRRITIKNQGRSKVSGDNNG